MDNRKPVPPCVDETTVQTQDEALAVVQRLLTERGIRAHRHHTISLGLFAAPEVPLPDRPPLRSWMNRYPPELAVIGSQGRDATVTIGACSCCYLVAVRGSDTETVRCEEPERVLDLILAMRQMGCTS
ncbi:hypothetical protein OG339_04560 [Streptosporangium sp. NBC_01495]|uniref:hypothetical protein n=1 Tax=Streptosporangium sp. NBC_01495 TaxID=2903899 RepID=UPI002E310109|nr:hypothetical protein [Streptosporangium sp. NBC_01495]